MTTEPTKLERLKQKLDDANRDYQFAIASGDLAKVSRTKAIWTLAFAEYSRIKKAQFKKTFVSKYK